ncbi:Protein RALF-like 9 [Morella rubra]|uniref:Protein RALF-like 9 n=1 Tax=Morella rubra TaxID=262757 RepID=A0A6A1VAE0_9ROSI|nr:Protein RALF-like 9 [Morella rubra]
MSSFKMVLSKGSIVVWLCVFMVVVCGLLVQDTNAVLVQAVDKDQIGNPAMGKGAAPNCDPSHPGSCHDSPANHYQRGCEKINDCRGNGKRHGPEHPK